MENATCVNGSKLSQLPDEMWHIIKSASPHSSCGVLGPRLGRLAIPGRRAIDTPHYLGNSSRGVVPHITQDTFRRDTNISGVYAALEDFIERAPKEVPPIYKFRPPNGASPLRKFTALPDDTLLVLGARRNPPVIAPAANPNTNTTVSICTSVGFRFLEPDSYAEAVELLKPDIAVALGDIPYGRALGNKRVEKATDRNIQWLQDHIALRKSTDTCWKPKLFPSLLPVSCAKQQYFVEYLNEEAAADISGLAFFTTDSLEDLPESLSALPRLALMPLSSPHDLLRNVALGLDVFSIPFIGAATDAGIALDFMFPAVTPMNGAAPLPLGLDMWSSEHAVDLSSFSEGCKCYACTNHHRAYVQHLLAAKEMLGWVLLQIHNHHVMDMFFAGVRHSISQNTFEADRLAFAKVYGSDLPEKTGQGPRIRGYQYKAEGPGEAKKNVSPFNTLDDSRQKLAEATPPEQEADARDLEDRGFAEKDS